ncbi:hypothetical protein BLNAU_21157 [Blattamonas nauphoetae]|uniref:Uncharacterized protein n=1 Tax=Blattamonas nauphoetae TaxID=2049346 RepID=A0ABQ9WYU6_9EUKA|nr:hypothetical protein BLNAU_21157 [Blattamonas nauphoetae]
MLPEADRVKVADSIMKFVKKMTAETPIIDESLEFCLKISDGRRRMSRLKFLQNISVEWKGCEPDGIFRSTLILFCKEFLSRVDEQEQMLIIPSNASNYDQSPPSILSLPPLDPTLSTPPLRRTALNTTITASETDEHLYLLDCSSSSNNVRNRSGEISLTTQPATVKLGEIRAERVVKEMRAERVVKEMHLSKSFQGARLNELGSLMIKIRVCLRPAGGGGQCGPLTGPSGRKQELFDCSTHEHWWCSPNHQTLRTPNNHSNRYLRNVNDKAIPFNWCFKIHQTEMIDPYET